MRTASAALVHAGPPGFDGCMPRPQNRYSVFTFNKKPSRMVVAPSGRIAALLLTALLLCSRPSYAQAIEVLTSPERSGATVDTQLLRGVFTMRIRAWPDGTPTRVFVLPDGNAVHDRFCRELLGTYPYVLRSTWDRMVFTGTGLAPVTVKNEQEMKEKVRITPGAIGYASADRNSFIPAYLLGMANLMEGDS